MTTNKSWCPIPWNSVSTRLNGYYRLCSQSHADKTTMGIFRDDDGTILTAEKNSIDEARNCHLVKEVREHMLKGIPHPSCHRCNHEDALGITSRRQWSKAEPAQITLDYCIKNTKENGEIDVRNFGIREADLRFGNFCNIKCRSCWPGESTSWYKDWYGLGMKKFNVNPDTVHLMIEDGDIIAKNDNGFRWYEHTELFSQIAATDSIKKIHISGGEPIFIKKHHDFLEMLISSGNSRNITLDYNSNITNIPNKIIDTWKNFKTVQMGASIDGIGHVNDYIRHPSKWKKIEDNFKKLLMMENCKLWVTSTVMIYNVFYLPELFDWVFDVFGPEKITNLHFVINTHLLRNPEHLNIQVLPFEVKQAIKNKIFTWMDSKRLTALNDDVKNQVERSLSGYMKYMDQMDLSSKLPEFFSFTSALDQLRNERFSEALPELHTLLKPYSV